MLETAHLQHPASSAARPIWPLLLSPATSCSVPSSVLCSSSGPQPGAVLRLMNAYVLVKEMLAVWTQALTAKLCAPAVRATKSSTRRPSTG